MKNVIWIEKAPDHKRAVFECPGCGCIHAPVIEGDQKKMPVWRFNGSLSKPTFTPSILVRWNEGEEKIKKVCHSFVTDGKIRFLNDCTHELAGKTVELKPI